MRVGVLGGSFDPIHRGHVALGRAALRQLKLDRVYFVVSPRSPFKLGRRSTPAALRFSLVQAALKTQARLRAADWELKRRGPSYTVTTLRAYHRSRPADRLFLILGSDALAGFSRWRRPLEIVRLASLVVGRRPGAAIEAPAIPASAVRVLKGVFPPTSSTKLRADLAAGRAVAGRLPPGVLALIRRYGLYGTGERAA